MLEVTREILLTEKYYKHQSQMSLC
uniref:Uncharacterized protein n=1 Tax=Rhizophora mucronata TaxID=61149 RepID=A0A2P2PZX6_RHIMU